MNLFHRFYSDFIMPSRLQEYEKILKTALSNDYKIITLRTFAEMEIIPSTHKYFIVRHDIDSDVETAKMFFAVEKSLNITASYYFRLITLDYEFMKEIESHGGEASYHFEEIATFCMKNGIKSKNECLMHLEAIRNDFISNYYKIQNITGLPMKTVVSHGHFINRKIGQSNNIIINQNIRALLGIIADPYDQKLRDLINTHISDCAYPNFYRTEPVINAIQRQDRVICFLTHPNHWRVNRIENTKVIFKRILDGIRYKF